MNIRKYILSFLLIATSAVYVAYQKIGVMPAITPISLVSDNQASSTLPVNAPAVSIAVSPAVVAKPKMVPVSMPVKKAVVPISAPVVTPAPVAVPAPVPAQAASQYKDGQYTGASANAFYGNVQVQAIISGGKLTDVQVLDYPQDRRTSQMINSRAMPILVQEAIQAQSANVATVSGATDSSGAFQQSLSSALAQAQNT